MELFPSLSTASNINVSLGDSPNLAEDDRILEVLPMVIDGLDGGWIGTIVISVILVFGTFGNIMTVIVLQTSRAGSSAMNVYLTALAMSDMAMLYSTALPMWARKVINFDLYVTHVLVCKGFIWVMHSSAVCSSWLLVALTVQRAVSVAWPHRVNIVCTVRKSVVISISIALVAYLIYTHSLYGHDIVRVENGTSARCTFAFQSYQTLWVSVYVKVDNFLFCVFPVIFVTLSNAVLIWKLAISVRKAKLMFSGTKVEQKQSRKERASSTTATVIIVSVAFMLSTVPTITYNTFFLDKALRDQYSMQLNYFLYDLLQIFTLSNFAWNFYLYCLTGRKFRTGFLTVFSKCCGFKSSASKARSIKE